MRQIALPLSAASDSPSRIVVGSANIEAVDALLNPKTWPFHTAILSGPPRSGKSLIARWFRETGAGVAVDDAPSMDEDALFHLWNRTQESGRPLLLISDHRFVPGPAIHGEKSRWRVKLPDLSSRLASALNLEIVSPDEEMMADLIEMHAELRGLGLDHAGTQYLAVRAVRTHVAAEELVTVIDRLSLERKQAPTMTIWRDALIETNGDVSI